MSYDCRQLIDADLLKNQNKQKIRILSHSFGCFKKVKSKLRLFFMFRKWVDYKRFVIESVGTCLVNDSLK